MNQVLRNRVYGKGNRHHIAFLIDLCGFNETEASMFRLLHEGRSDQFIEDALGITKPTREALEESIGAKLGIGIFECINKAMDIMEA